MYLLTWALMIIDNSHIKCISECFRYIFVCFTVFSVVTHSGLPKHCKTHLKYLKILLRYTKSASYRY